MINFMLYISTMKQLTPKHLATCFYTMEEQAQYAGVSKGTYCNATQGPAYKRYMRRVLFTLIKDLAHEAASDPRNASYYRGASETASKFIASFRQPSGSDAS